MATPILSRTLGQMAVILMRIGSEGSALVGLRRLCCPLCSSVACLSRGIVAVLFWVVRALIGSWSSFVAWPARPLAGGAMVDAPADLRVWFFNSLADPPLLPEVNCDPPASRERVLRAPGLPYHAVPPRLSLAYCVFVVLFLAIPLLSHCLRVVCVSFFICLASSPPSGCIAGFA